MVSYDPDMAVNEGSPALAMLILALGGAIACKALPRPTLLARVVRRETSDRREAS